MQLESVALVAGVRLIPCGEVASTNTQALAFARRGERGPLWVTARRQTEGRGRRGNAWVSDTGNLFASLLLTDPAPPAQAGPPKPGLTDITSTRSIMSITYSIAEIGVPGLSETPAFLPSARIACSERCRCGPASACTVM